MSPSELAAHIQEHLSKEGIQVVLSGGSAVALYSSNQYVSRDLDLINVNFVRHSRIKSVLQTIGFEQDGRHFVHPETEFSVEFPDGPLSVGDEPVREISEFELSTGTLRVLSPTDCVKDRLCAFYFWNDRQGLAQAVMVTRNQQVNLEEVKRWSIAEGKTSEFEIFASQLE